MADVRSWEIAVPLDLFPEGFRIELRRTDTAILLRLVPSTAGEDEDRRAIAYHLEVDGARG